MGYLYLPKGSTVYWCKWYSNGKAIRESTRCKKKGEAEKFLAIREGAKAKGEALPVRLDRISYQELRDDLLADYERTGKRKLSDARERLKPLDAFFGHYRAVAVTAVRIGEYVSHRQKMGLANSSINRELGVLKKMLRLAARKNGKLLTVPYIEMLTEPPPRSGFFEPEQWATVRKRLPEDLQLACHIGYTFGWRVRSEVLGLQRRQVDLKAGTLVLARTNQEQGRQDRVSDPRTPRTAPGATRPRGPGLERDADHHPLGVPPPERSLSGGAHQGISAGGGDGMQAGRGAVDAPARFSADGDAEHDPPWDTGARRHDLDRAQKSKRL